MSEMNEQRRDALPPGARLDGDKYEIEEVLGSGGFGVVYRAHHRDLGVCVLKEYLPSEIAVREGEMVYPKSSGDTCDYQDGLNRFRREAQQLIRFSGHPNIVRCRDYVTANGTAYLVMDFEDGLPLDTFLAGREAQGQPLTEAELRHLLRPLLEGLATVHAEDVLHRDIKPENVFVRRRDGQPVLLDFGAAKEDFSKHSRSRAPHTPGYAAPEQVEDEGHLGPWTDVYAVGALMWRAVSGAVPPKVENRWSATSQGRADPLVIDEGAGGGRFSADLLAVMRECLHLDKGHRPQSAEALLAMLDGKGPERAPEPNPPPSPPQPDKGKDKDEDKGKGKDKPSPLVTVAVCALGLGLWLLFSPWRSPPPPAPERVAGRTVGEVFRDALRSGGEGPQMVVLPMGSFRMGSSFFEVIRHSDEGPVRTVTISRPIAMGRYEVTFADYDRFADADSRRSRPDDEGWGRGSRPVINVNWNEAKAYATWLSAQTGKTYRLPSEAEWEYAARVGTRMRYSWGNWVGRNRANCDGCGSEWDDEQTAPVGSFAANAFGLYDLHGNVWEWVEDCWHNNYQGAPTDGRAWTTGCDGSVRAVVRGGSWNSIPRGLRSAYRDGGSPSFRFNNNGFRLVQDLNP